MSRLNILVLYGANATLTSTVMEHARSFSQLSRHRVHYASIAPFDRRAIRQLPRYDVAVLHYSFFPGLQWQMPPELEQKLAGFRGLKVLFLQDEYDNTLAVHGWIRSLGIQTVYTCIPANCRESVYPSERFPGVTFEQTLTGFVPRELPYVRILSAAERPLLIGYRGRQLHPRYGDLGREKSLIGERMREICAQRGIAADIETAESKRIYGRAWYEFLAGCRATLGSESGANVLDADGTLRACIDAALAKDPGLNYKRIHERFIGEREGAIRTNQVSPRLFESVALRTALVLFEGHYSGTVEPWEHYLPLRKDFSNVDDVLRRLADPAEVDALTARAHEHVIGSSRFSYEAFIRGFDAHIESRAQPAGRTVARPQAVTPPSTETARSLRKIPRRATNLPFNLQWVERLPENITMRERLRRIARSLLPGRALPPARAPAARPARRIDAENAEFWNQLCGSSLAQELGIRDHSLESLERFDRAYLDFYPYLLDRVPVGRMKDKTVLEIGLGYGTLGQRIAETGADYVGLDVAEMPVRMMGHRLAMLGLPGRAIQGSMLDCPLADASVDVVVSIGCFHHTGDVQRCIEETFRVLRPGGEAYVMVYNRYSLRQWKTWPLVTLRAWAAEMFGSGTVASSEHQRKAYDLNLAGEGAPETAFLSRASLQRMFGRFSALRIRAENSDPLSVRGRTLVSRKRLLKLGWLWGLDLYVEAVK